MLRGTQLNLVRSVCFLIYSFRFIRLSVPTLGWAALLYNVRSIKDLFSFQQDLAVKLPTLPHDWPWVFVGWSSQKQKILRLCGPQHMKILKNCNYYWIIWNINSAIRIRITYWFVWMSNFGNRLIVENECWCCWCVLFYIDVTNVFMRCCVIFFIYEHNSKHA